MCQSSGNKSRGTAGGGSATATTSLFSNRPFFTSFASASASSSRRNMDASKFVLCFLILFNVPSLDRGSGVVNHVASATLISISTSKGTVIMDSSGQTISSSPAVVNSGPAPDNRKWNHYQTALSNTGLNQAKQNSSPPTSSPTLPPSPTTTLPTTVVSSASSSSMEVVTNDTRKPSSSRSANKTYHVSFNNNNNNKELLNNARKYIASYEDLQSRFPDGSPFENNTSINMTVPLGDTAFLRCRVRNLGERSISWIRRRDWHILTTGKTTYTNDERFNVLHVDGTEEWTLQIKFVQKRDNGTYECQVSTGTGIISYFVNLFIAVPEAFILGNGEYHVEQGSNINLVCVIEKSPKPPEYIFWYHNEWMINYGSSREVVVRTEPGARTHSRLTIRDAKISDSGNYTCKTAHAEPASIYVYVSQASGLFSGDKMAAIQRRKTSGTNSISSSTSSDSSPPEPSSSSAAASVALTAATTLPTLTALVYSITELATSFTSSGGVATKLNSSTGNFTKANFLLTLLFLTGTLIRDVAAATFQLLLSLLILPVLLLCGGTQLAYLIVASDVSSLAYHNITRQPVDHQNHHFYQHRQRDYCDCTNNHRASLPNSVCEQQFQLDLAKESRRNEDGAERLKLARVRSSTVGGSGAASFTSRRGILSF